MQRHSDTTESVLTSIALLFAVLTAALVANGIAGGKDAPITILLALMGAIMMFVNVFGVAILTLLLPWYALQKYIHRNRPAPECAQLIRG
jgi:hypothetical protein